MAWYNWFLFQSSVKHNTNKHLFSLIAYLSSEVGELGKLFKKTADSMNQEMRFAHTTSKEVKEKYGMEDE